jgi:hypothetical protein
VNLNPFVCGIRLQFRRVKPDGTFDTKDAYAGEWIGDAPAGEPTKLVNDGRKVIGIKYQQGAIVDRLALVVEAGAGPEDPPAPKSGSNPGPARVGEGILFGRPLAFPPAPGRPAPDATQKSP